MTLTSMHDYYNKYGGNYFFRFRTHNPEFDCDEFRDFVCEHNRGDRDLGELNDIAKHEVLRLAAEYTEERWRFPNCYGEAQE